MKDEQKLNLLRLAINNASDFDEAKSYASLILGGRILLTAYTPLADNGYWRTKAVKEDGVYIAKKGFPPVCFKDVVGVQNPKKCNVVVRYHGHEWVVAKNDILECEIHLLKYDAIREKSSPLYKSEIKALNDFDMKSCTDHLRKSEMCFNLGDDLYIPTVGQLAAMYIYKEELNEALRMVCGTPMKEDEYWSSSEYSEWGSWGVNVDSGCVGLLDSKCYSSYVRPCISFELKKK